MPALCWNRYRWAPLAVALVLGAGAARAATITVTIEKMAFSPTEVSARIGDTIEWVNKDAFAHTATVKGGFEVMLHGGPSASPPDRPRRRLRPIMPRLAPPMAKAAPK